MKTRGFFVRVHVWKLIKKRCSVKIKWTRESQIDSKRERERKFANIYCFRFEPHHHHRLHHQGAKKRVKITLNCNEVNSNMEIISSCRKFFTEVIAFFSLWFFPSALPFNRASIKKSRGRGGKFISLIHNTLYFLCSSSVLYMLLNMKQITVNDLKWEWYVVIKSWDIEVSL